MGSAAAAKAASVKQRELPGHSCRANFLEMFSVSATDHVVRARPTAGSDRGTRDLTFFVGRSRYAAQVHPPSHDVMRMVMPAILSA